MIHPDFDLDILDLLALEVSTIVRYCDELFAVVSFPIEDERRYHGIPGWVPHNYGDLCTNPKLSPKYLSNKDRLKWKATSCRKHR